MFAYDCLDPVRPKTEADGEIYDCEMKDLEEVVYFLDIFNKELSIDQKDISGYREDAEAFINTGNMYLWKDKHGQSVASCKYAPAGDITNVKIDFSLENLDLSELRGKVCRLLWNYRA